MIYILLYRQDEIVTRCKSLMDQSMPITSTLLELIENKNSSATLFFGDLVKSIVDLMESVARYEVFIFQFFLLIQTMS